MSAVVVGTGAVAGTVASTGDAVVVLAFHSPLACFLALIEVALEPRGCERCFLPLEDGKA